MNYDDMSVLKDVENEILSEMKNKKVKIVVNKNILDTKEFDRDMRFCSILGYENNDKKIQVLKTQDVYAVALIKQSKKLYPNSLDFVFVTKKDNLKDVTTVIALPASFIENIEDVEKSLFQMPDDEEITKKFNKYREIQIEKYKELQLAEAKRKENNTNLNLN